MTQGNPLAADLDQVLERTSGLWEDLRGARVFLTGGTGFFGCWLLETLLWADDRRHLDVSVLVLTRNADAFRRKAPHLASHPAVALHDGDVCTFVFPERALTHVIHAGTDTTTPSTFEDRLRIFDSIVSGTRRALDFARHAGAARFLLTSTGAVYGRQPSGVTHITEDYPGAPPVDPLRSGAEAKRAAETLCALYADAGLQPTIARCFAFVGAYLPLDAHLAAGNFIRDGLRGGPIHVTGDGTAQRSYMYGADLAAWLWTILLRGQPARPYNVGSEDAVSIAQLAHAVARRFTPPAAVRLGGAAAGTCADRYVPSTARARGELGLRMTVDLDEALARTIGWYRPRVTSTYGSH